MARYIIERHVRKASDGKAYKDNVCKVTHLRASRAMVRHVRVTHIRVMHDMVSNVRVMHARMRNVRIMHVRVMHEMVWNVREMNVWAEMSGQGIIWQGA
jgi:hypothetical protein